MRKSRKGCKGCKGRCDALRTTTAMLQGRGSLAGIHPGWKSKRDTGFTAPEKIHGLEKDGGFPGI
jgi:hypothetical protein